MGETNISMCNSSASTNTSTHTISIHTSWLFYYSGYCYASGTGLSYTLRLYHQCIMRRHVTLQLTLNLLLLLLLLNCDDHRMRDMTSLAGLILSSMHMQTIQKEAQREIEKDGQ